MLHFYGCSYGFYGTTDGSSPNAHKWSVDGSIPYYLSQFLHIELNNQSWAGATNFQIFDNFIVNGLSTLQKEDILIFQWPHIRKIMTNYDAPIWLHDSLVINTPKENQERWYNGVSSDKIETMCNVYNESFFIPTQEIYKMLSFNEYIRNKVNCRFYYSICDSEDTFDVLAPHIRNMFLDDASLLTPSNNEKTMTDFVNNNPGHVHTCKHPTKFGCSLIAKNYADQIIGRQYDI